MRNEEYMKESAVTAKGDTLEHGIIGLIGEVGELADCYKRNRFYESYLNRENAREELGDILWYVAMCARALDTTISELMDKNIHKLMERYPDGKWDRQMALEKVDHR